MLSVLCFNILFLHPFSGGDSVYLTFWYLISLHIVSIKVKVTLVEAKSSICGRYVFIKVEVILYNGVYFNLQDCCAC